MLVNARSQCDGLLDACESAEEEEQHNEGKSKGADNDDVDDNYASRRDDGYKGRRK